MKDTRINTDSPVRRGARWARRHPRSLATFAAIDAAVWYLGVQTMLFAVGIAALAGVSWRLLDQPTFDRFAGRVMRAWWLRWSKYQRQWARIAYRTGLVLADPSGLMLVPKISRVGSISRCWDTVEIKMIGGQIPEDYAKVADRLANAYKACRANVRLTEPGRVAVDFQRREPFNDLVIPAPAIPHSVEAVDLSRLPIGLTEYERALTVSLVENHLLGAGETGAGKGSIPWGILRAIAPLIRAGLVRPWVIDPKGGMEFGLGREMFHEFADNDADGLDLLDAYVDNLNKRKVNLGRTGRRKFTMSTQTPLELLIVDELAAMTEYASERGSAPEFERLIGTALTQFRAPGGVVMAFTQEPTKDIVPMRGLFPTRIALRLAQESYVDMTLGEGVRDMGAFADKIPSYLPGVGYLKKDGIREPIRFRTGHTADEDIAELVRYCLTKPTTNNVRTLHGKDVA